MLEAAIGRGEAPMALAPRSGARYRVLYALLICVLLVVWAPGFLELPGGVALGHAFTTLLFVLVLARAPRLQPEPGRLQERLISICFLSAAFVCFWAGLSVIQTDDPIRVARPIIGFGIGLMLYFSIVRALPAYRIDAAIMTLAIGAGLSSLISLLAVSYAPLANFIFAGDRSQGLFKHPNQFAITLSTVAPVVLASFLAINHRSRFLWLAVLGLIVLGYVLAGSKANAAVGIAALGIVAVVGALMQKSALRSLALLIVAILAGICAIWVAWELIQIFNPRMGRLILTLLAGDEIRSVAGRYSIWDQSIREFLADPLFGQGGGATLAVATHEVDLTHSHNVILDALRTLGLPGGVAVVIMLLAILYLSAYQFFFAFAAVRVVRLERLKLIGLSLGSVSYIVANMSSDSFGPSTSPIFWIVFTLSILQTRKVQYLAGAAAPMPRVGKVAAQ